METVTLFNRMPVEAGVEREFVVTLNNRPFTADAQLAVNTAGQVVKLADMPRGNRFQ